MATSRKVVPMKYSPERTQQKPQQVYENCLKILKNQTLQQISKWMIQNRITTMALKSEKCISVLNLSTYLLKSMVVQNQSNQQFLKRVVDNFKNNSRKAYEYCRVLKYFAAKDYELQYIFTVAKSQNTQKIPFYLKCRSAIIESFLNKAKKELLNNVYADQQQWFKIVKKLYKNIRQEQMIQLFTDTIKYHYINIKKNQSQQLNGAQIFRICQIINKNIRAGHSIQDYDVSQERTSRMRNQQYSDQFQKTKSKQKKVKRLFDKNVVDGLESEDRQLIRILSYKDNNIAKLLQQKHEKMIELIVDDVQTMRKSIEQQKKKYVQLWKQKQQVLKLTEQLNNLTLNYMANDTLQNQQKLLKVIQNFNSKYRKNADTMKQAQKIRQSRKNKRMIQIIQRQERQKD